MLMSDVFTNTSSNNDSNNPMKFLLLVEKIKM